MFFKSLTRKNVIVQTKVIKYYSSGCGMDFEFGRLAVAINSKKNCGLTFEINSELLRDLSTDPYLSATYQLPIH